VQYLYNRNVQQRAVESDGERGEQHDHRPDQEFEHHGQRRDGVAAGHETCLPRDERPWKLITGFSMYQHGFWNGIIIDNSVVHW
jgi:hypothetical protein